MDTSNIELLNGSVNVTIHKNYLKDGDASYAKVQRTTAGMNNVIASICSHSSLLDKATLVAAQMLFKSAILELLQQGVSVNVLELGTLYPTVQGNIDSANPSVEEIPSLTLKFTPSEEALNAVAKASVSMAQLEETSPIVNQIEDLSTHKTDCSISAGMPIRITGRRLKIAGDEKTGVFLAPVHSDGSIKQDETDWIKIEESRFFKNTASFLELILPFTLEHGLSYTLVIRTAAGRGNRINKTVRSLVYDKVLTVA